MTGAAETPLSAVHRILRQHMHTLDPEVPEAVLATMLANRLPGPPVWLMLVAPPSLGKTAILEPLEGIYDSIILSKLTPQTLLSGNAGPAGEDLSLLTRLGEHPCIIIKELSTLLEDPKGRAEIFAQFRDVYDGQFSKAFGMGRIREWRGKATLLIGITPAIDLYSFDPVLGPRFFKFRFRAMEDPEALALAAWGAVGSEGEAREQLAGAYRSALQAAEANLPKVRLSDETIRRLASCTALLAKMRTGIERNKYRQDRIELPPEAEGTPRAMKALGLLATALAALRGESDLTDFNLINRITFDCMPEPRRSIFGLAVRMILPHGGVVTVKDLMGIVGKTSTYNTVEDLAVSGVLEEVELEADDEDEDLEPVGEQVGPGRKPKYYTLSSEVIAWLERSRCGEFLLR